MAQAPLRAEPWADDKLDADERETLRQWILAGAPYEEHWAFVVPERPALPEVADES